ncbi:MAG: DNA mismatch repair protein MutS, partial [Planctomycetota bacterium]
SLSQAAYEYGYHRPEVVDEFVIQIKNGRHPVLERVLETSFVANDLEMNPKEHLLLITGPNMAGKSTYIRQAGLIVLMAQMGSFVPAESARIGVVDRIFTRLGSTDELYMGYSTFMIEMLETANILNNATRKSLVLLDEVGRGTSTYDGVSLAWALSEYLHDEIGCRTLFATHYHELTQLPRQFSRMKNLSVAIREWEKEITFLHKIQEGPTKRSYGIHVAQLAGMPPKVIQRAEEILQELETASPEEEKKEKTSFKSSSQNRSSMPIQLPLFQELKKESKVMKKLRNLSLENLTPLEALLKLKELQDLANS